METTKHLGTRTFVTKFPWLGSLADGIESVEVKFAQRRLKVIFKAESNDSGPLQLQSTVLDRETVPSGIAVTDPKVGVKTVDYRRI